MGQMGEELRGFLDHIGTRASVIFDHETHAPTILPTGEGLRELELDENYPTPLVEEINIATVRSLHVALYALQNPTPENIDKALEELAYDSEEHLDHDTFRPLPVPPPHGWETPA